MNWLERRVHRLRMRGEKNDEADDLQPLQSQSASRLDLSDAGSIPTPARTISVE